MPATATTDFRGSAFCLPFGLFAGLVHTCLPLLVATRTVLRFIYLSYLRHLRLDAAAERYRVCRFLWAYRLPPALPTCLPPASYHFKMMPLPSAPRTFCSTPFDSSYTTLHHLRRCRTSWNSPRRSSLLSVYRYTHTLPRLPRKERTAPLLPCQPLARTTAPGLHTTFSLCLIRFTLTAF